MKSDIKTIGILSNGIQYKETFDSSKPAINITIFVTINNYGMIK